MSNGINEKTFWAAFSKDRLHISEVGTDEGDVLLPEFFAKKSHGKKYHEDVRKVKIVEVK